MTTPVPKPVNHVTPEAMRALYEKVDVKLRATKGRHLFDKDEVVDLLLDVRIMLDTLSSPATLVYLAKAIHAETQAFERKVLDGEQ